MELALVYSLLIFAVIAILQSKKLYFLDPYRSLYTIVAAVIAIITFYVLTPVPEWIKYTFIGAVIIATITIFLYSRKRGKDGSGSQNTPSNDDSGDSVITSVGSKGTHIGGKIKARNYRTVITDKNTEQLNIDAEIDADRNVSTEDDGRKNKREDD